MRFKGRFSASLVSSCFGSAHPVRSSRITSNGANVCIPGGSAAGSLEKGQNAAVACEA